MNELPFTGERFVPGTRGEIWIEHWHRYHFASRWAAGKRVLDVACGEGYGSALLARAAESVTGVDISKEAIDHAKAAYAGVANLDFHCAPCTALPLDAASIDVAVSFETLEHIAGQSQFLDELSRVLVPGGVLLLSCPNKLEYTDKRSFVNEFHVKELYREELAALLAERWPHTLWFAQRPAFFSVISPEGVAGAVGELVETDETDPSRSTPTLSNPLYFIVAASRDKDSLASVAPALSVLSDRGDWVHRDYEKVMRMHEDGAARVKALAARLRPGEDGLAREGEDSFARLHDEVQLILAERDGLQRQVAERETALEARKAEVAARDEQLCDQQRELDTRRSWRWWLKLPLVRLGLLK